MIISQEIETFDTCIFQQFLIQALIIDADLATNLPKFSKILLSLATIASNISDIPLEEILNMQKVFNYLKTYNIFKQTNIYPIILTCFIALILNST